MMTGHTPDKWCWINSNWAEVEEDDGYARAGRLFSAERSSLVLACANGFIYTTPDRARLIAAAPEMYEELTKYVRAQAHDADPLASPVAWDLLFEGTRALLARIDGDG